MNKKELERVVATSVSISEVCRYYGFHTNGRGIKLMRSVIRGYNIPIDHFSQKAVVEKTHRVYDIVQKRCPICDTTFDVKKGHIREKVTCSRSCSNTHFRSGVNNPNWKRAHELRGAERYRRLCFERWDVKCAICDFDKVVDVHHIDGDHDNNDISNLIPLCPNHHMMIHTKKYGADVQSLIETILRTNAAA